MVSEERKNFFERLLCALLQRQIAQRTDPRLFSDCVLVFYAMTHLSPTTCLPSVSLELRRILVAPLKISQQRKLDCKNLFHKNSADKMCRTHAAFDLRFNLPVKTLSLP